MTTPICANCTIPEGIAVLMNYSVVHGSFVCDICGNTEAQEEPTKTQRRADVSLADQFENDVQSVIYRYCGEGLTVGTAIGALQNRIFDLMLNLHMPSIIEKVLENRRNV